MMVDRCTLDFVTAHPEEASRILERFAGPELEALLRSLPAEVAAHCLERMAPSLAAESLGLLDSDGAAGVVGHLPVHVAAPLLRRLDRSRRAALVTALSPTFAAAVRIALRYPRGTVGALVDPQVVTVREDMSVKDAVDLARRDPKLLRKYLYVSDERSRLLGAVDVRQCLVHRGNTVIGSLAEQNVIALRARTSLGNAREHPGWERFEILPVVDRDRVLLGVLRRSALDRALAEDAQAAPSPGVLDAALELAELYWDTSMELFLPRTSEETPPGEMQEAEERR